jgi:hypothetical protein
MGRPSKNKYTDNRYSKDHLAKTLKTSKMNITYYIQSVENGIKMAALVRGTEPMPR